MAKPKHDYDSDSFYNDIYQMAINGMTDKEIASALDLDSDTFGYMKNGSYERWDEKDRKRRGERIVGVLSRARDKIVPLLRTAYMKGALGGKKIKGQTVVYARVKCDCGGDINCELCQGTGYITSEKQATVQETIQELPPSMQALGNLLYHYDPEWRKVERKMDEEASSIPTDIEQGISIDKWINDNIKR